LVHASFHCELAIEVECGRRVALFTPQRRRISPRTGRLKQGRLLRHARLEARQQPQGRSNRIAVVLGRVRAFRAQRCQAISEPQRTLQPHESMRGKLLAF
jgi:hypothetical protein